MFKPLDKVSVGVVGLGYVGLPIATLISEKYNVIGYDNNALRVESLLNLNDYTNEVTVERLREALTREGLNKLSITTNVNDLSICDIIIVTVPTPVTKQKQPDLSPLKSACQEIGKILTKNTIVVFESTVYPGCTEEICVPLMEEHSGLRYNSDFYCGYSPERINPGDKVNTLTKIKKVTSGSTEHTALYIDEFYRTFITAGTHLAPNMKVAEAAKAVENVQRDINISLMNELSLIFDRMNIDTFDVLEAAKTKWNFMDFKPGLVGGHCISVDPYYLTYSAQKFGYTPEVILSGRKVNDFMGTFVAQKLIKKLIERGKDINKCRVLILGYTFKENCSDTRNTKVEDVIKELLSFHTTVDINDPWVDQKAVNSSLKFRFIDDIYEKSYDALLLAVKHEVFDTINFKQLKEQGCIIFDTKSIIDKSLVDIRL